MSAFIDCGRATSPRFCGGALTQPAIQRRASASHASQLRHRERPQEQDETAELGGFGWLLGVAEVYGAHRGDPPVEALKVVHLPLQRCLIDQFCFIAWQLGKQVQRCSDEGNCWYTGVQ